MEHPLRKPPIYSDMVRRRTRLRRLRHAFLLSAKKSGRLQRSLATALPAIAAVANSIASREQVRWSSELPPSHAHCRQRLAGLPGVAEQPRRPVHAWQ
jgi:hypothetical protein